MEPESTRMTDCMYVRCEGISYINLILEKNKNAVDGVQNKNNVVSSIKKLHYMVEQKHKTIA
jgi:hypothetical protein